MGGMGGGSDLGALRSTIAQNDLWTQAAQPILGARFDNSNWSPGTTLGVSAGQAFLGALLGGMGQRSQAQQLEKVAQVLPALYENPGAVVAPEGVDREAFGILKLGEMAKNQARTVALEQDRLKRSLDIMDAGLKKKAETKAEIEGKQDACNQSGTKDPESPVEKKAAEHRDRFEKLDEVRTINM